ncbi:acyl-CoA carboxylase epsilon subunit [Streptomyces sp. NPDC093105]|uniref:acyl-CoA carboxylase epsilon subunit n=1 Tax=Streptomyces sp. NPDC093105 TaxID=3366029 RepID=UPI00382E9B16
MSRQTAVQPVIRVERGHAAEEELAVLTAVLLALAAERGGPERTRSRAGSQWWRRPAAYCSPTSWR